MKILIVNGSPRKNGVTARILESISNSLHAYKDVEVRFVHLADLQLTNCVGCSQCFKNGKCIFNDDLEKLSKEIEDVDGIILGSPTYASNVSGQMKVFIDRGHFVIEQLLYGKYAISVTTYENYGGREVSRILQKLLSYSGAQISNKITVKLPFSSNAKLPLKLEHRIQEAANLLYHNIRKKRLYKLQTLKHYLIFKLGIAPFVKRKGSDYQGVMNRWKRKNIPF